MINDLAFDLTICVAWQVSFKIQELLTFASIWVHSRFLVDPCCSTFIVFDYVASLFGLSIIFATSVFSSVYLIVDENAIMD
jgi:hypothetical protein